MFKSDAFLRTCAVFMILSFGSIPISAQNRDLDDEKPLFFVNTNSTFEFSSGGNYGFTKLKEIVEEAGYRFDHGLHPEINEQYLEGISVYFLPIRKFFLLDEEKVALRKFIRAGGTVIMTNWSYIRNEDTFAQEFGIEYRAASYNDNYGNVPASSPVSKPYQINRTHPGELIHLRVSDSTKAVPLAYTEDGYVYAAEGIGNSVGQGSFFVLSCMRGIHDNEVAGYVYDEDNANFLRNLMEHIKGSYDLGILRVKPKGSQLEPGDIFTCIAKIKNFGTKASEGVKLEFYITDDGNLEEGPATNIKMVKSASFLPLEPGKSRLVKLQAKIPSWINPGSYILVAKVDPNETSDDDAFENNLKVAKRKLVIK